MKQFAALSLLVILLPVRASADAPHVSAPYQIDGVVRFKDDRHRLGEGLGLRAPLVAVDLGTAGGPYPDEKKLARMTFVGGAGMGFGTLQEIRKHCDFLCGEGGEECYYVGLYALDDPLATIGTPLAGIPGVQALAGFRSAQARSLDPASFRIDAQTEFLPLAWAPYGRDGPAARVAGWNGTASRLDLDLRWRAGDVFSGDGEQCRVAKVESLIQLQCNPIALILGGGRVLLVSYPDYNAAAADVVAVLGLGKSTLYLVRLGLKAQTVFGLLYRNEAGWRGLFRPRDHALLC